MQSADTLRCVVFAAGDYYDSPYPPPSGAFVVAADGGYDHARAYGCHIDAVVGDFDSTSTPRAAIGARTVALPPEKDDPDLLSALKIGWRHGAREFHILGALGGRVDHTISNIQQTALVAAHGGIAYLHGDGRVITAICDAALEFPAHDVRGTQYVSVFSHTDSSIGVYEEGLKYRLDDATLTNLEVNGLSNEFVDGLDARISVRDGILVVVFDDRSPLPTLVGADVRGDLGAVSTEVTDALVRR
ncbi:thiamine diphosphokinase [uncultured Bifidobacterium sp.]|uniref:thiamine diphosphokinase n=1 Tax=uncultured Bifidobacterium sp. TaxID=165187 RepID=UPI002589E8C0|nr:thiamine diphosphokinase [uncultured Bifidobacterium sp.]MEE0654169.1 thiamine diphosphokinase [Bifidobacterium criceti]